MRSFSRGLLLSVSLILLSSFATPSANAEGRESLNSDPARRIWLYFGANAGFTSVSPAESIRESDKSGYAANLKVLGSKYWRDWVLDVGIGYQIHGVSGDDRYNSALNSQNATVKVDTRAGFVEISPRYRLDEHWQIGPVLNGFFGTDVSFDESTTGETSSMALAVGARVDWETEGTENRWRFGAQILRDLTISNRDVTWVMLDVQFGFPFGGGNASDASSPYRPEPARMTIETEPAPQPTLQRVEAPKFAEVAANRSVKIYLGEAVLRFKTASAQLRPSSKTLLRKVAAYLRRSPNAWKMMRIEGHADKRGKIAYNMRLSEARANRVRTELVVLGLPKAKTKARGFGPNRPIDRANDLEAYALNRRVELWLDGVTDPETVVRDLNAMKD